jgi:hypothetical protein
LAKGRTNPRPLLPNRMRKLSQKLRILPYENSML